MDGALVHALSAIPPPSSKEGNSIAISGRGEIAVLSEQRLYFATLQDHGENSSNLIREADIDPADLIGIHHIEFIVDFGDSKLLLWGDRRIGIVAFNTRNFPSEKKIPANFTLLLKEYFCNLSADQRIVHCAPHPESSRHVGVLLCSGPFLVINSSGDQSYEGFQLDLRRSYASFAFSSGKGWMRWTVYLLSADGRISYLCPVIPKGIHVSKEIPQELEVWIGELQAQSRRVSEIEEYTALTSAFVRSVFGSSTLTLPQPSFIPQLQDPLIANAKSSYKRINDIRCIGIGGLEVPLIAAVTEEGEVLSFVLTEEPCPLWSSFNGQAPYPLPEALLIERIAVRDAVPEGAAALSKLAAERSWCLKPDPLVRHAVHVIGATSCSSFLVSLDWLPELSNLEPSRSKVYLTFLEENPSSCVPVFANVGENITLSGVALAANPLFGHFALFRSSIGTMAMVNLSVHLKLCSLMLKLGATKRQMAASSGLSDGVPIETLNMLTDSLLKGIYEGINSTPSSIAGSNEEVGCT